MPLEIIGDIAEVETIATGSGIREMARLRKHYGSVLSRIVATTPQQPKNITG